MSGYGRQHVRVTVGNVLGSLKGECCNHHRQCVCITEGSAHAHARAHTCTYTHTCTLTNKVQASKQKLEEVFRTFDTSGDGQLDR
eukprot:scaffold257429_cov24-Tisochrysis_lutea.AAC.2